MLEEMGYSQDNKTSFYAEDNLTSLRNVKGVSSSAKPERHRAALLGFLRHYSQTQEVVAKPVPSEMQWVDSLTKIKRPVDHWMKIQWLIGLQPGIEKHFEEVRMINDRRRGRATMNLVITGNTVDLLLAQRNQQITDRQLESSLWERQSVEHDGLVLAATKWIKAMEEVAECSGEQSEYGLSSDEYGVMAETQHNTSRNSATTTRTSDARLQAAMSESESQRRKVTFGKEKPLAGASRMLDSDGAVQMDTTIEGHDQPYCERRRIKRNHRAHKYYR
jgi:hypothetical protein